MSETLPGTIRRFARAAACGVCLLFPAGVRAADETFCPFVIPAAPDAKSLVAVDPSPAIALDSQRVVVHDGHFYVGDRRVRFWGVNLTFASDFPSHADAEQLALRLRQAGVNCVRFHHMDTENWPSGIWDKTDPQRLSEEALDRLDYLLGQFANCGIYADINLHVGRTHSKFLGLPVNPEESYDKMIDLFTPQIAEAEKRFATQLLGHVNKYRGVRIADDPETAIVEISNEDSLFMWGAFGHLRSLPPYYADLLRGKFIAYLKDRYTTSARLHEAWQPGAQPLSASLLADGDMTSAAQADSSWILEQHPGATATIAPIPDGGAHIDITHADNVSWHIQFQQRGIAVHGGLFYTLRFDARADKPRTVQYGVSQSHDPWANLGLSETAKLTPQWTTFTQSFTATQDEAQARLSFSLSNDGNPVEFRHMLLAPGGRDGLAADESLEAGNVALFKSSQTENRERDTWQFLAATEKDFYDGMRQFVKHDLNCYALVTGTIVFGPLGLYTQSDMDFIDGHSYWQHPRFPGRPWDMGNWLINQVAMVDTPGSCTLFPLAAERLGGKPFTVTEYNHPAPNDFQAECVPLLASFAAAQDWDGVFLFDYGPVPNADKIDGFFGVGSNPAKWGFMAAGAAIFRDADSGVLPKVRAVSLAPHLMTQNEDLIALHAKHNLNLLDAVTEASGLHWQDLLESRLSVYPGQLPPGSDRSRDTAPPTPAHLIWRTDGTHGLYESDSERALVWVGFSGPSSAGTSVDLAAPSFAAIMLTSMDAQPLFAGKKVLLCACGRCENPGMIFSADRQTVGRNWGNAPAQIQGVDARIHLPSIPKSAWTITPLGPDGRPSADPRPLSVNPGEIEIKSTDKTMWYLLSRQ